MFYNENKLLEYRLNTLNNYVDYFVIVESTHTHSGHENNKLHLSDSIINNDKFKNKIIHIIVDDLPYKYPNIDYKLNHQWNNEYFQRNAITRGLEKIELENSDLIIITDIDEIPDRDRLYQIKQGEIQVSFCEFKMDFYYFNLNSKHQFTWSGAKIISYQTYKELGRSPQHLRLWQKSGIKNCCTIIRGGWHLSYFGNSNSIQEKIKVFSHQEFNKEEFTNLNNIENRIKNGLDLYGRKNHVIQKISIKDNSYLPHEYETYLTEFYVIDSLLGES
jgi:beta-1,4-mannosyl-glycoprotein beta-1,4-N-acetylglucosaminyltransferase